VWRQGWWLQVFMPRVSVRRGAARRLGLRPPIVGIQLTVPALTAAAKQAAEAEWFRARTAHLPDGSMTVSGYWDHVDVRCGLIWPSAVHDGGHWCDRTDGHEGMHRCGTCTVRRDTPLTVTVPDPRDVQDPTR
jgi:hypothetical protein